MTRGRRFLLLAAASALLLAGCGKKSPAAAPPAAGSPSAATLWAMGVAEVNAGRPEEAVAHWRGCLAVDPANADCQAGLRLLEAKAAVTNMPGTRYTGAMLAGQQSDAEAGRNYLAAREYHRARNVYADCLRRNPAEAECLAGYKLAEQGVAELLSRGGRGLPTVPAVRGTAPAAIGLTVPAVDPRAAVPAASGRSAAQHWAAGLLYFQKGDYAKARDEWQLCLSLDPVNPDCKAGVARIDAAYGADPAAGKGK